MGTLVALKSTPISAPSSVACAGTAAMHAIAASRHAAIGQADQRTNIFTMRCGQRPGSAAAMSPPDIEKKTAPR
jgi:hypothetical protein